MARVSMLLLLPSHIYCETGATASSRSKYMPSRSTISPRGMSRDKHVRQENSQLWPTVLVSYPDHATEPGADKAILRSRVWNITLCICMVTALSHHIFTRHLT